MTTTRRITQERWAWALVGVAGSLFPLQMFWIALALARPPMTVWATVALVPLFIVARLRRTNVFGRLWAFATWLVIGGHAVILVPPLISGMPLGSALPDGPGAASSIVLLVAAGAVLSTLIAVTAFEIARRWAMTAPTAMA